MGGMRNENANKNDIQNYKDKNLGLTKNSSLVPGGDS